MEEMLKSRILGNEFLDKLRISLVVDRAAFDSLCKDLVELNKAWRGQERIDKEVVQLLYVLAPVTQGMARSLEDMQPGFARELSAMATKLDALVLECLSEIAVT
jgi:hypothetical protein